LIALSALTALWEEFIHLQQILNSHKLKYGSQKLPSEGSVLCPNATSKQGSSTTRITAQRAPPNFAIPPRKSATACHIPNITTSKTSIPIQEKDHCLIKSIVRVIYD